MKPLISIIVRTYNLANLVESALESIFRQTLTPDMYEIVVVDDGSTDGTQDVIARYAKKVCLILQDHAGFVSALNTGINAATARYIIILDGDDTFEKTILEDMAAQTNQHPEANFIYCDYYEHKLESVETKTISTKKNIFDCLAEGILFKKSALKKLGLYDENLFFPEYDILIRLTKQGEGIHIPKPLFTYNRHAGSLTSKQKRVAMGKRQLTKKYGDIPEIAKIRDY